ncbi:MAG: NAD-dependent malic enzyme [Clostridiales bacterium]|nr:NAD-dependent malic enzyme [Clostridiales bacterium]
MDYNKKSLKIHEEKVGKISIEPKINVQNSEDLSLAYTPGVAAPCKEIHKNKENVFKYTSKGNLVAVVTDGTAVLGLGDIGPEAAMPVMEGKSILFKEFADVDAFPICLDTKDTEDIINTIKNIAPTFGGINLEDICAPKCFEIEERLKRELDIPVFHDDQHGTAIVVFAGIINALKITEKNIEDTKIVINGAGAAGIAIAKMLINMNPKDIILCDSRGIVTTETSRGNKYKEEISRLINKEKKAGSLKNAIESADIFIGVSVANALTEEMVKSMNKDPIIFALANPIPEIMPEIGLSAGARIMATGRSDFPNQINNVLAFPGIFRGALDVNATDINKEMKLAAAYAIANSIDESELREDFIIPDPFNKNVAKAVAKAVAEAAIKTGIVRK